MCIARANHFSPKSQRGDMCIMVDLRINETRQTGAVSNRPYRSPVG